MKHSKDIQIISVRLPADLHLALQRAARRRSVDEDRMITGPQIIRELVQREFGENGWNPDLGHQGLGMQ
jgi:hypothetical protein